MKITVKLRNDRRRITQTYEVKSFSIGKNDIVLILAYSLKSHITYECLEFNRNDWRMI